MHWRERQILEAQSITTVNVGGEACPRVPYGGENISWDTSVPCHDCEVRKGQLHVLGCDVEQCPCCERQLVSCDCTDVRDEEDESDDDSDAGSDFDVGRLPLIQRG